MGKYIPEGWEDYSSDGWNAESSKDAGFLVLSMHRIANKLGSRASILNASNPFLLGWDKILQFAGVRIEFQNQDYGCSVRVVIIDEEKIEKSFFALWKLFVDKDLFQGGPFRKELFTKAVQKARPRKTKYPIRKHRLPIKPWELLPDIPVITPQKREMVKLWCEGWSAKEISEFTLQPGKDLYNIASVHNLIGKLRSAYPEAKIPLDTDRKKTINLR